MTFVLDSRAKLRAAFFRFLNTGGADSSLAENDTELYESAHYFIQHGLWSAQDYILRFVDPGRWLTSVAISAWSGSETTDGGTYFAQPADLLMLAGSDDFEFSAIREPNGTPWGRLIRWQERFLHKGAPCYFLLNERIYKVIGASVPSSLVLDYHHRHALLDDDADAIDMPVQWRPLIVAFAAMHAKAEDWLVGGSAQAREIEAYLAHWKGEVMRGKTKSHAPPRLQYKVGYGPNQILPTRRPR